MSKPSEFSDKLNAEGAPTSPASLDKKILAYAREQVPDKNPWQSVQWMTALAACSVAVVSIMLVMRTPLVDHGADTEIQSRPAGFATEESRPPMASKQHAPEPVKELRETNAGSIPGNENRADLAEKIEGKSAFRPGSTARLMSRRLEPVSEKLQISSDEIALLEYTDTNVMEERPEIAAKGFELLRSPIEPKSSGQTESGSTLKIKGETLAHEPGVDVDSKLRELKLLVAENRNEEAEKDYRTLVEKCQCQLPETLAQALTDLAERE